MYSPNQTNFPLRTDGGRVEKCTITFPATAGMTQADYIQISSVGKTFALWLNKDVGYPGVKEVTVLTIPSTAAATQADYIHFVNQAGTKYALWLDIDADGTVPTGALYVASNTKIKCSIVTGGSAIANAAIVYAAINGTIAGVTMVNNLDATITITQSNYGAVTNALPKNANDSGAGSCLATVNTGGLDPVIPTGAVYTASSFKIRADIATGDLAPAVGTKAYTALIANSDFMEVCEIKNNLNGTLTIWQDRSGNVTNPVPKSYDDAGAGSITAVVNTAGINKPNVQAGHPTDFTNEPSIIV